MPVITVFEDSGGDHWQVRHGFVEYKTDEVLPVKDIPQFIEWLQSEYAKHKHEAKADDDGWIKWEGGECPVDVMMNRVDVKWRSGSVSKRKCSDDLYWKHNNSTADIIAYRLSQ